MIKTPRLPTCWWAAALWLYCVDPVKKPSEVCSWHRTRPRQLSKTRRSTQPWTRGERRLRQGRGRRWQAQAPVVLVAINFRSTHLRHETLPVCAPLRRPGWNVTLSGLFWGRALSARHPGRLDALVSTRRPWGPPGGPAGRPRRLACHALFFLLVPSTLAHAIGPGVCAHSDGSEPGRHCRARAVGTPRARPLSPPRQAFSGEWWVCKLE